MRIANQCGGPSPPCATQVGMSSTWVVRCALGALAFLLALIATYAGLRAYDVLFGTEPNPVTVMYQYGGRIAMYWRVTIGAYVGGAVALLVIWLAQRHEQRVTRALVRALPFVMAFAGAQAVLLP